MERIFACRVEDLSQGSAMTLKTAVPAIAVYRTEDDDFYATQDMCTHEDWSLGDDCDIEGATVVCPLHMASFDLKSGKALCAPAELPLKTYTVEVDDGSVYVLV